MRDLHVRYRLSSPRQPHPWPQQGPGQRYGATRSRGPRGGSRASSSGSPASAAPDRRSRRPPLGRPPRRRLAQLSRGSRHSSRTNGPARARKTICSTSRPFCVARRTEPARPGPGRLAGARPNSTLARADRSLAPTSCADGASDMQQSVTMFDLWRLRERISVTLGNRVISNVVACWGKWGLRCSRPWWR